MMDANRYPRVDNASVPAGSLPADALVVTREYARHLELEIAALRKKLPKAKAEYNPRISQDEVD